MAREQVAIRPFTIHWGAILGGSFVALGAWMFFLALGSAIGGTQVGGASITWTSLYTLVSPILGLFAGGLVAARSSRIETRSDGAFHGVVIWGFAMVLGAILIGSFGAAFIAGATANLRLPTGYSWAIAGAILGSLISAVLGASTVSHRVTGFERERERVPGGAHGEART